METPLRQRSGPFELRPLIERIRRAVESQDVDALAELYADDAVLEEVSSLSPPAHPRIVHGREAIAKRFREELLHDPVSGWSRTLQSSAILDGIETEDAVAFTEVRTYEAGDKVVAQHLAHKRGGRIAHDRVVVAWDPGD